MDNLIDLWSINNRLIRKLLQSSTTQHRLQTKTFKNSSDELAESLNTLKYLPNIVCRPSLSFYWSENFSCPHHKIFKVCLTIFQNYARNV